MIIATATDRSYVEMTGVMLHSIAENAHLPDADVIVFGDRLRTSDERLLKAAGGSTVEVRDVANSRGEISRLRTTVYWPTATYIRLLAPNLIADDRLLYLDCDIIINRDLRELSRVPLDGRCLAAVPETSEAADLANRRLGRPRDTPYFNAGVLLINAREWRSRDLQRRTIAWLEQHPGALAQDQDALNALVGSDWQPLDRTYNSHCLGKDADPAAIRSATIIHFTGRFKPMQAECRHPARSVYLEQRAHTPWATSPLVSPRRRKMRRLWQKARRLFAGTRKPR
jgi:lipopolysaccharide biosynthesis glycosyltransferase